MTVTPELREEIVQAIVEAIEGVLERHGVRLQLAGDGDQLASPDTVGA